MAHTFFSIVIVSLNPGQKLAKTVESVLCQEYGNFEIIIKDGGSGTPGAIDRENYDPGLGNDPVDPEDPNATEDPSQTDPGTETTDPGVTDPGTTETPSTDPGDLSQLSQADQQVLADLQKIMDSFDVNTTSLQVIQGTIDQVKALASRDGISPEMSQILNDSVADLQAKYDELDAILNG